MIRGLVFFVAVLASFSTANAQPSQSPPLRDAISLFADSAAAYVAETFDPAVASLRLTTDARNLREVALASTSDDIRSQATDDLMPLGAAAVDLRRFFECAVRLDQYEGCGEDNTFFLRLWRVAAADGGRLRIHASLGFPSDRPTDTSTGARELRDRPYFVLKPVVATLAVVDGRWCIITLTTL